MATPERIPPQDRSDDANVLQWARTYILVLEAKVERLEQQLRTMEAPR